MQVQKTNLVRAAATIFEAAGSSLDEAEKVATRLVDANLTGHDSHGVIRIPQYVENVGRGTLRPNQSAEVVSEAGAVIVLDGHFGYGQIVGEQTIDMAIAKARTLGIAMTTLRNAGHLGRIGDWASRAADAGMVSLNFVNAIGHQLIVVPHGGAEGRGSTNPIAIGVPIEGEEPVILDFATSAVAEGKVRVARNKGTFMPPDCLLDADGKPTIDPRDLYADPAGALLPFGAAVTGHKGGGLWLMADLLAGGLSAGGCSRPPDTPPRPCSNMLSIAIDPAVFADQPAFAAEVKRYADFVKSAKPRDPEAPVMLPGEPERKACAERLADGINVDPETWSQIVAAGASIGVEAALLDAMIA
ncbi:MAG: malate/lactate/ureidoglycolate dehydrogenase [Alphaproteobacteria bacterium]|nr:malate/lactate/ureidoglycolate dehydrogenase [Alphaproteobacteria bacterium]